MKTKSLHDLYVDELKDLYDAEQQLVKTLPKMAKAATSPQLQKAFEAHLEETKGHVERLEAAFAEIDVKPQKKTCKAMKGLIAEGADAMDEFEGSLLDAALIGAAQRVEHYEMAGYGVVVAFAKQLGLKKSAQILHKTLEEEKAADEKLTDVAESDVNEKAMALASAE